MQFKKAVAAVISLFIYFTSHSQVIRNYTKVFSDNLKGGHVVFGNTMMSMRNTDGSVNLTAMNDFGNYAFGTTSNYGNDFNNMQLTDVDEDVITDLSAYGVQWKYYTLNNYSSIPPTINGINWKQNGYDDDVNWNKINTPFGFGETGTNNPIQQDRNSYYFRRSVYISNPSKFAYIRITAQYDDAIVVYVNGEEVMRDNINAVTPAYADVAVIGREYTNGVLQLSLPSSSFLAGDNQIAVEVHQASGSTETDDLYFNLNIEGIETTSSSSTADLILPAGNNTIKFARLYWGARINTAAITANDLNIRTIKIRKGTSGSYFTETVSAAQVDKANITNNVIGYQCYADITAFVSAFGAGTYSVADIAASTGAVSNGGSYAGWCIVVVYENQNSNYNSVRVYDGFLKVFNGGSAISQSITLTGLNSPVDPLAASDAYMSVMGWEGDANLAASNTNPAGDYVLLNGDTLSNAVNPKTNLWNGTISDNGAFVTTKNPDYKNQFGIDIDKFDVGTRIGPNATTATVVFGTEADQYFPSLFAFTMKMKVPEIILDKTVTDASAPYGALNPSEELTYTLSGSNNGVGVAYNVTVTDTLPANVTYINNSLQVNACPGITPGPKTDNAGDDIAFKGSSGGYNYVVFYLGNGANSNGGGQLQPGESYSVSFKVNGPIIPIPVTNTARVSAVDVAGNIFTDDGTASIAPASGLPVTLTQFSAIRSGNNAVVRWTTSSEMNNDHFEIERSEDAISFIKVGTVQGMGNSNTEQHYQFIDPLNNIRSPMLYYRLRTVERGGIAVYSRIVPLRLSGNSSLTFSTYPNPFTSSLRVLLNAKERSNMIVRISSIDGRTIISRNIIAEAGENIIVLKDLKILSKGTYIVELTGPEGTVSEKIIKE
jgi:uncharacterized repeat protein (TIGR01451 family)